MFKDLLVNRVLLLRKGQVFRRGSLVVLLVRKEGFVVRSSRSTRTLGFRNMRRCSCPVEWNTGGWKDDRGGGHRLAFAKVGW